MTDSRHHATINLTDRATGPDLDTDHPQKVELWPVYRHQAENREFGEDDDTAAEIVGLEVR